MSNGMAIPSPSQHFAVIAKRIHQSNLQFSVLTQRQFIANTT